MSKKLILDKDTSTFELAIESGNIWCALVKLISPSSQVLEMMRAGSVSQSTPGKYNYILLF